MAVRKRAVVQPTERSNAAPAELRNAFCFPDEEMEPDEELRLRRLVTAAVRESVAKEWVKGFLAIAAVIAGAFLCTWDSKTEGFAYWFIHISGLVVFCVGLALAVEFIKLLIGGALTKATVALVKGLEIKEWMRVFLAFLSIGAGICFALRAEELTYYLPEWMPYCIGIVLIAGGITYFWTRSKFYDG